MEKVFSRVLIKDKDNNFLVIQDRAHVWNFPGGKQEMGETPMECAKREVEEEIGLHVHKLTEIFQGDFIFGEIKWRGHFYFADCVSGIPMMKEFEKIKGIRFIESFDLVIFPEQLIETIHQLSQSRLLQSKTTSWI